LPVAEENRTKPLVVLKEIDLEKLRLQLARHFAGVAPAGYVRGKGDLRAAVVRIEKCSEMEAEQLVDTLESRGLIRYSGERRGEVDDLEHRWELGES
jgi:hypothetical protein